MIGRDRIMLHGIEVWAHHGVSDAERRRGQPFTVDVILEADLSSAAASDNLDDTIDYAGVAESVTAAATGGPHRLLETVAASVLEAVLDHPRVRAAEVTVGKPHAPLPVPADGVSVTLSRERNL